MRTDHFIHIDRLRGRAITQRETGDYFEAASAALAADLLEMHDATGISLDGWATARLFVELQIGCSIQENRV